MNTTHDGLEGTADWFKEMLMNADPESEQDTEEVLTLEHYLASIGDMLSTPTEEIFDDEELRNWVNNFLDNHKKGIYSKSDLHTAKLVASVVAGLEPYEKLQLYVAKALSTDKEALMIEKPKQTINLKDFEF